MSKGSIPDYYTEKKELSTAAFVSLLVTGAICMAVGIRLAARLHYLAGVYNYYKVYKEYRVARDIFTNEELQIGGVNYQAAKKAFLKRDGSLLYSTGMPLCISLTCIGIGLIVGGIIAKFQKTVEYSDAYYHREFSAIPTMIVDEKDLVTTEFEDGELKRSIQFDQYAYYEAVRCNRQEVGALSKWQKGVDKYEEAGCGDVADLNADHGLEWLALYTVKAGKRGDLPILADSLKLIYSDQKRPGTITPSLHFFGETGAADLADRAYCYHNDKGRIYFTWGV